VTPPQGLFGWVDVGCDTERLARTLFDQGWLLAPGTLFHAAPRPSHLMRINFATTQDPRFWHALQGARDASAPERTVTGQTWAEGNTDRRTILQELSGDSIGA